jgi:hypothetical protein
MKRILAILAACGLLSVLATAPVAATTTKIPFTCEEHLLAQTDPGTVWIDDGLVLHVRGAQYRYAHVGDPLCAGVADVVVNLDLDLATSEGELWGTNHIASSVYDGGYDTTWHARFITTDPLAPSATDIWIGRFVGHGYGELAGWQTRGVGFERTHVLVMDDGYAFVPGDR